MQKFLTELDIQSLVVSVMFNFNIQAQVKKKAMIHENLKSTE